MHTEAFVLFQYMGGKVVRRTMNGYEEMGLGHTLGQQVSGDTLALGLCVERLYRDGTGTGNLAASHGLLSSYLARELQIAII